ncbi:MAG: LuxR C-terminal-related transcriptional regulator [Halieaceae bacterium]|jgi:LuxR family maltose regulon positive regulatory protein|nr:LuxR C-terminal-related transcriptional regulator [Halieaceae bacterium]
MKSRPPAVVDPIVAPFAPGHKFIPPLPLSGALGRGRLTSGIQGKNPYCAVVIQGPAGHGKTTLMQQLLQDARDRGAAVGWLTLDESDNDISRLSACLTTLASSALEGRVARSATVSHRVKSAGTIENILATLSGASRPVALFLDEFQVLEDPVILGLLNSLLERIPPEVTFYIGSRSIPELARGRLMISGRVKWITPEDLCFTQREVYEFLQNVGLPASESEAQAFQERTGGWPAVLQLLQLALRSGKLSRSTLLAWAAGCQSELRDYLADNVMSHQPAGRREFLLRTSILRRLTAPLCELLVDTPDAQQVLQDLVTQGLFLRSIDVEHRWFRYHSIFSDYLKAQLQRSDPKVVDQLHRKAAGWFRDHGLHEEAIFHAIEGGQSELAADVLEQWMPDLVRTARLRTVERLVDTLPHRALQGRPMLLWGRTWALLFLNQAERARQSLEEFEQSLERRGAAELRGSLMVLKCAEALIRDESYCTLPWLDSFPIQTGDIQRHQCFEMSCLANAKAISRLQQSRFAEAKEFALLGESMGARGEAAFSGAYSTTLLAYAFILEGRLDQALNRLHEVFEDEHLQVQGSFASASLAAVYGFALYEAGRFVEAESQLRDSMDMIMQTLPVDWLISAFLSLARATALSETDGKDSREILDDGERLGLVNRVPRLVRAMRQERIRLAVVKGNCTEARYLMKMLGEFASPALPAGWVDFAQGCDDHFVCETRTGIFCDDPLKYLPPLQAELAAAQESHHARRQIKLLTLLSLAYDVLGDTDAAHTALLEALRLAAPAGYVSTFLEEGPRCADLLARLVDSGKLKPTDALRPFAGKLLASEGVEFCPAGADSFAGELFEPLTRKEISILKLLVNGSSNAEIADQLFVSKNTIKFHLKNIYAKLGVANRVQATGAARKLSLV